MDDFTNLIKTEIKRQYKSVRKFSVFVGIPQTTIASTLKNGVDCTAFGTIIKICKALGLPLYDLFSDSNALVLIKKFNALDDFGKHTVNTIIQMEYERCAGTSSNKII